MNRTKTLRTLVVAGLAALLGGCSSAFYEQPEVTLEGVQVAGLGLRGGTLLVDIQVVNPNRFALSANQLQYELALSDPAAGGDTTWVDFAKGTYDQPFSVGAGDTERVQIPVEFSYAAVTAAGGSILNRGTLAYRATGSVDVRTPIGTRQVPFRKRGTFTMAGMR